jgi:hypothetical protein
LEGPGVVTRYAMSTSKLLLTFRMILVSAFSGPSSDSVKKKNNAVVSKRAFEI